MYILYRMYVLYMLYSTQHVHPSMIQESGRDTWRNKRKRGREKQEEDRKEECYKEEEWRKMKGEKSKNKKEKERELETKEEMRWDVGHTFQKYGGGQTHSFKYHWEVADDGNKLDTLTQWTCVRAQYPSKQGLLCMKQHGLALLRRLANSWIVPATFYISSQER